MYICEFGNVNYYYYCIPKKKKPNCCSLSDEKNVTKTKSVHTTLISLSKQYN